MRLVQLLYCSNAELPVNLDVVRKIASTSAAKNEAASITGILAFDHETYIQALEGPRDVVNNLYLRIARDPRHADLTIISYEEIEEREFGKWSMGFIGPIAKSEGVLEGFDGDTFNPFELRAETARKLLRAAAEAVLVSGWRTDRRS